MSASAAFFMYRCGCARIRCAEGERPPSSTFVGIESSLEDGEVRSKMIEDVIWYWTKKWTKKLVLQAGSVLVKQGSSGLDLRASLSPKRSGNTRITRLYNTNE